MRTCPNCSQPLPEDRPVCPNCGTTSGTVWPPPPAAPGPDSAPPGGADETPQALLQVGAGSLIGLLAMWFLSAALYPVAVLCSLLWWLLLNRRRPPFVRGIGYSLFLFLLGYGAQFLWTWRP